MCGVRQARPAIALLLVLLLAGCDQLPLDYPRARSVALQDPDGARLARWIQPGLASHPGRSGFRLLASPLEAYVARLMLIDAADRTLDVQYFIFEVDRTGRLLAAHLLAAADRGVRVRLLVDDWNQIGKDHFLTMLASHPNIQVRTFNPIGRFRACPFSRPLAYALGPKRMQTRMHNKALIADNTAVIVGGRNIGDEYFAASDELTFGDVDLLGMGPIARPVSAFFDEYWNDPLSIPIQAFVWREHSDQYLQKARRVLDGHSRIMQDSPYLARLRESKLVKQLETGQLPVIWAEAEVLFDHPDKVAVAPKVDSSINMGPRLREILEQARSEALLISPYFVPRERGVIWFKKLCDRGVHVEILTNSLASTDEPPAHGGYARYRKDLLRLGVELYEARPTARPGEGSGGGSSRTALHSKVFVLDRQTVFVGSFNLDPRSARLDTQNGIMLRSPALAAELARLFRRQTAPAKAFHVMFKGTADGDTAMPPQDQRLVWIGERNGKLVRYCDEPLTGLGRHFSAWFLSLILPEVAL